MSSQVPSDRAAGRLVVQADPQDRSLFRLETRIFLPVSVEDVFAFFSDARELETLTPPWVRFRVVTPTPIEMRAGTVIDYQLRIRGIPIRWRSVVPVWEPPHRFVDEQVRGPYRYWRHEHQFESADGGTLVSDRVDYRVRGGRLINRLFVQPDVERIFRYRLDKLDEIFSKAD